MKEFLTHDGYLSLTEELDYYIKELRPALSESLKYASSLGDLPENAEFDAALRDYQDIENKIYKLERVLNNCEIVSKSGDTIGIGSIVTVEDDGEVIDYSIVGPSNVDPLNNKISYLSDFGSQIMGKVVNDVITIKTNNLEYDIKILNIN